MIRYSVFYDPEVCYLPISINALIRLQQIEKVISKINRLGVYDRGLNPISTSRVIRIVSVSNLIPLKRVHLILEALELIETKNIEWFHFGDGPLFHTIEKQSKSLRNNIGVKLMKWVPNSVILDFYLNNHIDLFINVSETEGVPVSIMEAFSFGIPCFATNVGGTAEIVNKTNGCLVDKDFKINELSEFITNIRELKLKNDLRLNARSTFEKFCDAEKNYNELQVIFKRGCNS